MNSNKPLQDYLLPTQVDAKSAIKVRYPESKIVKLGFQDESLSVFEDHFEILIQRKLRPKSRESFELPLQACSDNICLLPEILDFFM